MFTLQDRSAGAGSTMISWIEEEAFVPELTATNHKLTLAATPQGFTINDVDFACDSIDRACHWATIKRLNGAYQGTDFWLKLQQGDTEKYFFTQSGSKDQRLQECQDWWYPVGQLLADQVYPRLMASVQRSIDAGESVRFGSVAVDRRGIRARRPLARVVPWANIVGTTVDLDFMRIVVRDSSTTEPKRKFLIGLAEWDVGLLPRLVEHNRGRA